MFSITVVVLSSFVAYVSSAYPRILPQRVIPPGFYITFTNSTHATGYGVIIQRNYGRYVVSCRSCLYCCTQRYQAMTSTKTTTTLSLKTSNDTTNTSNHPSSIPWTSSKTPAFSPCSSISDLSKNDSSVMSTSGKPCGILNTELSTVTLNITNSSEIGIFPVLLQKQIPIVNVTTGSSQSSYMPCNITENEHPKVSTPSEISPKMGILSNTRNQSCMVNIRTIEVSIACSCLKTDEKSECPCKQTNIGENQSTCSTVNRTIIMRNGRFNGNKGAIPCAEAVNLGIISEDDILKSCATADFKESERNNRVPTDKMEIPTDRSITFILNDTSTQTVVSSSTSLLIHSTLVLSVIVTHLN